MFHRIESERHLRIEVEQYQGLADLADNQHRATEKGVNVKIPLSANALAWLPERPTTGVDTNVFYLPTRDALREGVQRIAKKAGIGKDICFHTSCHTFGTMLIAAGVDIATVSSLIGHTSVRTTQNYAEVLDSAKIIAVNGVNGLFD